MRFAVDREAASAKERDPVLSAAAMAKFADEGYTYVGHAPLSKAPLQAKAVRYIKEAAYSSAAAAASNGAAGAAAGAGAQQRGGYGADGFPSDIVTYPLPTGGSAPFQLLKVEVMRGDPQGNVYYKS